MRVLQLIDSLEVGGAERVAVNMANALSNHVEVSHLCTTRAEGLLKENVNRNVRYVFLNKKSTFDVVAIFKLCSYISKHKITIIHAHSSSFFLATIVKIFNCNLELVWHDHYGDSDFLHNRRFKVLKACSKFFNHIFCVNTALQEWANLKLKCKSVSYLPNFAVINNETVKTKLFGEDRKRIICLANLREQKDHITLLLAFKKVIEIHNDWSLHLVGKDFNDSYSERIKSYILVENLKNNVFMYGSKTDTFYILSQCDIGVLSSKSEGLPLVLLEYGLAKLPVIATQVGECSKILDDDDFGLLVQSENPDELSKAIQKYIENEKLRQTKAACFSNHVKNNFSEAAQISTILSIYKRVSN